MATLKPKNMIYQVTLAKYLKLEKAYKEFEALKKELVDQLKNNYSIQGGKITAALKKEGRKTVAWKEKFIEVTSIEVAEEIMNKTPKTPVYKLVVVDKTDPII